MFPSPPDSEELYSLSRMYTINVQHMIQKYDDTTLGIWDRGFIGQYNLLI